MKKMLVYTVLVLILGLSSRALRADAPAPSPYPVAWELSFKHGTPRRIVVKIADVPTAQAYWYMTYRVTNKTDRERTFMPVIEMMTKDGQIIRSDRGVPREVFDAIKTREKSQFMVPEAKVGGELRVGEEETKYSVAIWPEPMPEMGTFSIFVAGLSGESAGVKGPDGKEIMLWKTLEITYKVPGDEVRPGEDPMIPAGERWVMR